MNNFDKQIQEDDECEEGLICQERNGYKEIKGCLGRGRASASYCQLPGDQLPTASPTRGS